MKHLAHRKTKNMALFFLGQLLFNIYFLDLLYFLEDLDIASYADNTAIYTVKQKNKKKQTKSLL